MSDESSKDLTGQTEGNQTAATPEAAPTGIARRDLLKALATVPILGAFFVGWYQKRLDEEVKRQLIMAELGITEGAPAFIPEAVSRPPGNIIRLGIIGYGGEGESLVRSAGFAHPDWIEDQRQAAIDNPRNKALETYFDQDDLMVEFTGVCDVFDVRAERGLAAASNDIGPAAGHTSRGATRFLRYTEMLESDDVDAVIIATPDHWHSRMCIDAATAGKHIYVEKAMTSNEEATHRMYDVVKDAVDNRGLVFQLGHQQRQTESHLKAKEVIDAGILGNVTLVETTTNRNDPWGAWVWDIHEEGSPETIDWEQFVGPAPDHPFSLERFFRWRCWFDYGTGLSGDLFSHEYDSINQILELGIPRTVVSSGGIYHFKDGRDVPDVFQTVMEYPDRDLTLVYSATLANGRGRGRVIMGHDATMEIGSGLSVNAERQSTRFQDKIEEDLIDPSRPMLTYQPGFRGVDAITSATAEYFASRGLLYTYRHGRRVNAYNLHIAEWLDVIRNGGRTSCDIEQGYQEAITCHMATRAYQLGRQVEWDSVNRRIV